MQNALASRRTAGASGGIGEQCAWRFAAAGCPLVLVARSGERLKALAEKIGKEYEVPIHCETVDVRDTSAIMSLPERLPERFRAVDILVNNAGLALGTVPVHEMEVEDCAAMVDTNVMGVIAFLRAFTPGMVARDRGHIINMSSIAGHLGYKGGAVYCGTKAAVEAITEGARHDLMSTRIRITALSPGAVKTNFSVVRYNGDAAAADAVYDGFVPLSAADIADNALYAATRPPHVQITQIVTLATAQYSALEKSRTVQPFDA